MRVRVKGRGRQPHSLIANIQLLNSNLSPPGYNTWQVLCIYLAWTWWTDWADTELPRQARKGLWRQGRICVASVNKQYGAPQVRRVMAADLFSAFAARVRRWLLCRLAKIYNILLQQPTIISASLLCTWDLHRFVTQRWFWEPAARSWTIVSYSRSASHLY